MSRQVREAISKERKMDNVGRYQELLDEDSVVGVAERREAIGRAIDELLIQMEQNHAQRQEIDKRDDEAYEALKKLDAAHARLSRGKRYTEKIKKRAVRRFWEDETHEWVERYLFEWARRQLQDGPKAGWHLLSSREMAISIADVIKVMSHHPETFREQPSAKPERKYARRYMEWTLTTPTNRFAERTFRQPWNVEIAILEASDKRPLTFSEFWHGILEDAIQGFYAKRYTSIIHAFSHLYWNELNTAYGYSRNLAEKLEAEAKARDQAQTPAAGGT